MLDKYLTIFLRFCKSSFILRIVRYISNIKKDLFMTPSQTPKGLIPLLGIAVGVVAANLYYAQPLIALISQSLGLDPAAAGLIVTLTQIGYGLGVLFIVPLGDLVENRKLILTMLGLGILSLLSLAWATELIPYFAAALAAFLTPPTFLRMRHGVAWLEV